ncbi:hypothetical protein B0J18DRAFT_481282 [Chaetomium sp. MPI-SDFR-AT-0129]|nr:hypothetical protein B0J18DRAFT_481282 [Chaetomium sp. MPI-SDFR-AT-0129]
MASGSLSSQYPVIDGIPYFVHPQPLAKVVEPLAHSDPIPAVVLTISDAIYSVDKALTQIDRFASVDDVYSQSFAHSVILQSIIGSDSIEQLLAEFKASNHFNAVYHTSPISPANALPPGPYFLIHGNIH